jgi:hypothetical protein
MMMLSQTSKRQNVFPYILFTLENSLHYRNQNDIVTGKESLPIRDW